jgi:hypothetical protein
MYGHLTVFLIGVKHMDIKCRRHFGSRALPLAKANYPPTQEDLDGTRQHKVPPSPSLPISGSEMWIRKENMHKVGI